MDDHQKMDYYQKMDRELVKTLEEGGYILNRFDSNVFSAYSILNMEFYNDHFNIRKIFIGIVTKNIYIVIPKVITQQYQLIGFRPCYSSDLSKILYPDDEVLTFGTKFAKINPSFEMLKLLGYPRIGENIKG